MSVSSGERFQADGGGMKVVWRGGALVLRQRTRMARYAAAIAVFCMGAALACLTLAVMMLMTDDSIWRAGVPYGPGVTPLMAAILLLALRAALHRVGLETRIDPGAAELAQVRRDLHGRSRMVMCVPLRKVGDVMVVPGRVGGQARLQASLDGVDKPVDLGQGPAEELDRTAELIRDLVSRTRDTSAA